MNLFAKGMPQNPYTEDELIEKARMEQQAAETEARRQASLAQKHSLCYIGGGKANYRHDGEDELLSDIDDEWESLMEKAKANAEAGGKFLTIINPNRDSSPYAMSCPRDTFDFRS